MNESILKAKEAAVAEIKEKLERSQAVILIDYRGLTVEEVTELRNLYRKNGIEYRVLKNTMIHRAAEELGWEDLFPYLNGPTAVVFGYDDPALAAKLATDFVKSSKKTEIKVGVVEGKVIDPAGVQALAELPSRETLIAMVLGTMNAPIAGLARTLNGTIAKLAYALNAIAEKKSA